jgi:hypothetical protein
MILNPTVLVSAHGALTITCKKLFNQFLSDVRLLFGILPCEIFNLAVMLLIPRLNVRACETRHYTDYRVSVKR